MRSARSSRAATFSSSPRRRLRRRSACARGPSNRGSRGDSRTCESGWRPSMSELELALTNLGREVEYPAAPDLVEPVRGRLEQGRRPLAWRRPLVIALAALLVVVAAAMAVPQARSQILDWLGIGSVTIRYVDDLPKAAKTTDDLGLGERMDLSDVRQQVAFTVRVP